MPATSPPTRRRWTRPSPRCLAAAVAAYAAAAVLFTWPLARNLSTKLTGLPNSDLGVYLWNLWVFRHEILAGHSPLFTSSIFSLDVPANLAQHNYTIFSDILAVPLLSFLGLVTSHNIVLLLNMVAAAATMFLLAFHVVRRPVIAWLAGLLFGFSPMLMARSEIHPSLAAAAPLPLFVFILFRLDATRSVRWAAAAGATLAWAAVSDPYYVIYCGLLAAWYLWTRAVEVRSSPWMWLSPRFSIQVVDGAIAGLMLVSIAILATGGTQVSVGSLRVGLTTAYTPNLLLMAAVLLRAWMTLRPRLGFRPGSGWVELARLLSYAALAGALLLSPVLHAIATRWLEGAYVPTPLPWRTSTPGADLMTLFMPNPMHPWLGGPWRAWLEGQPGGYAENITSITLVAAAVILAGIWFASLRVPRFWGGLAVLAGGLTLGPFVRVAGVETHLPGVWAVLRYLPVVGIARAPARFAVLLILAVAILFAMALAALADRRPAMRGPVIACVGLLLVFELCPAPRPLYDGTIAPVYAQIASDPRDVRVLELPFGVRDGLSSFGDFTAASQFHQTLHGKRLIGGYLSRVSSRRFEMVRRRPVLAALAALSEGRSLPPAELDAVRQRGPGFVAAARLGYVVVDRSRASQNLVDFAASALDLEKIGEAGHRELYRPRAPAPVTASMSARDTPGVPIPPPAGRPGGQP
jgi:hypothetical protein